MKETTLKPLEKHHQKYKNKCIKKREKTSPDGFIKHCQTQGLTVDKEAFERAFWGLVEIKAIQARLNGNV